MSRKTIVSMACLFILTGPAAWCAVPGFVSFQSRLTDSAGAPLEGTQALAFKIFNAESGGGQLSSGTVTATATGGLVSAQLPAWAAVFSGPDAWLEAAVGGQALSPRTRMVSVPYAFQAEQAVTAADPSKVAKAGDTMGGTLSLSAATSLTTTGNVGIGTSAPASALHVAGEAPVITVERTGVGKLEIFTNNLTQGAAADYVFRPVTNNEVAPSSTRIREARPGPESF